MRLLAGVLVVLLCACAAPATSRFPAPDRPVASIISPEFSDEASRDAAGEAERVMDRLRIAPGVRVADVGAGSGYYTVRIARRVGPGTALYAEDVSAPYLAGLEQRVRREGLDVKLVLGEAGDPKLPAGAVDLALLSHMYHEVQNPYELLSNLHRALAPGGRVAIIDVDRPTRRHGTPPALLRCELAAVGYREIDFVDLAPAEGYLAVFAPPATLPAPESIRPCRQ
jgi:SAM-dependent methyltransferase